MKRIFSIILSVFMIISNTCVVFASDSAELYAYTGDTSGYDDYATEKFQGFVYGHYGYFDSSLELGKGITIINENDYPKVLYPVWNNNEIVATFIVVNVDGIYSGTYREYTYMLNDLISLTNENSPLYLLSNEDGFFAIVDDTVYNMNESIVENIETSLQVINQNFEIINAANCMETETVILNSSQSRANPNSAFVNYWHTYRYDYDGSVNNHCYTFCLYNIFRNLKITEYEFSEIRSGILLGLGNADISDVIDWLNQEGFNFSSQNNGYIPYSSVYNILCTNDNYIMVGLSYVNSNADHFMAMYGCSSISGMITYSLWDPESNEEDSDSGGLVTMDGNTRIVLNWNNVSLKWDAGYIGCFEK